MCFILHVVNNFLVCFILHAVNGFCVFCMHNNKYNQTTCFYVHYLTNNYLSFWRVMIGGVLTCFVFSSTSEQSQTASTTRICQRGGVALDGEGMGPSQRQLIQERSSNDIQDLPKDYKRHSNVCYSYLPVGSSNGFEPGLQLVLEQIFCFPYNLNLNLFIVLSFSAIKNHSLYDITKHCFLV